LNNEHYFTQTGRKGKYIIVVKEQVTKETPLIISISGVF